MKGSKPSLQSDLSPSSKETIIMKYYYAAPCRSLVCERISAFIHFRFRKPLTAGALATGAKAPKYVNNLPPCLRVCRNSLNLRIFRSVGLDSSLSVRGTRKEQGWNVVSTPRNGFAVHWSGYKRLHKPCGHLDRYACGATTLIPKPCEIYTCCTKTTVIPSQKRSSCTRFLFHLFSSAGMHREHIVSLCAWSTYLRSSIDQILIG